MKKIRKMLGLILVLSIAVTTMFTRAFANSVEVADTDDGGGELVATIIIPLGTAVVEPDSNGTLSARGAQVGVRARFQINVYTNHTIKTMVYVEADTLFPLASTLKIKSYKVDITYMDMTNFDIPTTYDHATISTNKPGPVLDGTITSIPFPKGDTVAVSITISDVVLEDVISWESKPVSYSEKVVIA